MSTLGDIIQGIRAHGRITQQDITALAVTNKRILEAAGLFPGLMRGTQERKHWITDRAARKAKGRSLVTQENTASAAIPPQHQHSAHRFALKLLGRKEPRPGAPIYDLEGLKKFSSFGTRGTYTPQPARRADGDTLTMENVGRAIEILDYAKVEARVLSTMEFTQVSKLFVDPTDGGWGVFDNDKHYMVAGPYKDRKTANRRMRQLNEG